MSTQKIKQIQLPEILNIFNFFEEGDPCYTTVTVLPDTGEIGTLYYLSNENKYYYWDGESFHEQPANKIPRNYKYKTGAQLTQAEYESIDETVRDKYITVVEKNVPTGDKEWVIDGESSTFLFQEVMALPLAGEENIIYYVTDENKYYAWDGFEYIEQNIVDDTPYQRDILVTEIVYEVTNGVYEVVVMPPPETNSIGDYEYYSPNLIPNEVCYSVGISSVPGNKIVFNNNARNVIRVGSSGVFNMDFGDNPVYSLRMHANNSYDLYGTLIDLIYIDNDDYSMEVL